MESSKYDNSFHTLLYRCTKLIIPVVNEAFHENYTGNEDVAIRNSEHYINTTTGKIKKRISDSSIVITNKDGYSKNYHIECETNMDNSILVRLFEYDAQIALSEPKLGDYSLKVKFPHTAVIALRDKKNLPNKMQTEIETPGGSVVYDIPIVKIKNYTLDEILEKNLLFFAPFYVFNHEKDINNKVQDKEKLDKIIKGYGRIYKKLDKLQRENTLTVYQKNIFIERTNDIVKSVAKNNEYFCKGVKKYMGGKLIASEASTIHEEGIKIGLERGRNEGREEGLEEGLGLGRISGLAESVNRMVNNMGCSIGEAMENLGLDEYDRNAVTNKINEMKATKQENYDKS